MEFEKAIEVLREYANKDKVKIPYPNRVKDLLSAYNTILSIITLDNEYSTIEILPGALELGDVSIRITTSEINIYQVQKLSQALSKVDNINVYPTNDDRFKIDLQFYDVYYIKTI